MSCNGMFSHQDVTTFHLNAANLTSGCWQERGCK